MILDRVRRILRSMAGRVRGAPVDDDPASRLDDMIREAREQHRLITDQASTIVAAQRRLQLRLERAADEYEDATRSARQALMLADEADRSGDGPRAQTYRNAARRQVERTMRLEQEIASLEDRLAEASVAADQARDSVRRSAALLQRRLDDQDRILGRLDQVRLQEQLNSTLAQLRAGPADAEMSFDEVRRSVDLRLARARALGELRGESIDGSLLELEHAQAEAATDERLAEYRSRLGLADRDPAGPAEPAPEPAVPSDGPVRPESRAPIDR